MCECTVMHRSPSRGTSSLIVRTSSAFVSYTQRTCADLCADIHFPLLLVAQVFVRMRMSVVVQVCVRGRSYMCLRVLVWARVQLTYTRVCTATYRSPSPGISNLHANTGSAFASFAQRTCADLRADIHFPLLLARRHLYVCVCLWLCKCAYAGNRMCACMCLFGHVYNLRTGVYVPPRIVRQVVEYPTSMRIQARPSRRVRNVHAPIYAPIYISPYYLSRMHLYECVCLCVRVWLFGHV